MRKGTITYNKSKTVTTKEKESTTFTFERDYTQVYDCFSKMSVNINSGTSYKLLFWLLANKTNDDGGIQIDSVIYDQFNAFLISECGKECGVVRSTFDKCVAELKNAGALSLVMKGHYIANGYGFWRGSIKDRIKFLEAEHKNADYAFYNPDHDTKLLT